MKIITVQAKPLITGLYSEPKIKRGPKPGGDRFIKRALMQI